MKQTITINGKIVFEPVDRTKKHKEQSSWKRIAMVIFNCDLTDYYAWFIKKRYNLELNKPIRGAHISFINDSVRDLTSNGLISINEANNNWERVKKKWNKKIVPITLELDPRTCDKYWWLRVADNTRQDLQGIRSELNLGKPYFGLHLTIGYANEKNLEHSKYIHRLLKNGMIR